MPERILVYGMTDNLGGIETYLMNQLVKLDREKVIFDFVTDFETMAYADEAEKLDSVIYYIPAKSKGVFKQWKAFAKILKEHPEYKKVYFNILDAGAAVTAFIPWLFGRTLITHSHNDATYKNRLHRICRPFLLLFTKKRYACSKAAAEFMFGKHSASVIPNSINAEKYNYNPQMRSEKRKELDLEDKFVICHVGRLSEQKNPMGLIDIFGEVLKRDKNAVLLSIGSGEMEDEVHKYAESKSYSGQIKFLGKRNDVNLLMQAADVFLFPSFFEGFGIVAIEAQAAGLPCVLSDAVHKEVQVTENVSFISLKAPLEEWASCILQYKNIKRIQTLDKIIASGYDYNHPSAAQVELFNYFEDEG